MDRGIDAGVADATVPIEDAAAVDLPIDAGPTAPYHGSLRPYVNDQLNSRLAPTLPAGKWEVSWKRALDDVVPYDFLMQKGDRIILQAQRRWQLFDTDGERIARGDYGSSDIVIDGERDLVYMADRYGRLMVLQLEDGVPSYVVPLHGTDDYRRSYIVRVDTLVIVTSVKQQTRPHSPVPAPRIAVAQVVGLGTAPQIRDGILISGVDVARREYEVPRLLAARNEDTLVLTLNGRFLVTDLEMGSRGEFESEFEPLALSVDEETRSYLIVRTKDGPELWGLTPGGKRFLQRELPDVSYDAFKPPIVGYDHTVYVLLNDGVMAFSSTGELKWQHRLGLPVGGAVVTGDDRLLATVGGFLIAYDEQGEPDTLFVNESARWTTPPVLTETHRVLAATSQHVYNLRIER